MSRYRRTHRIVDGQRVEGTWRHIFVRNGDIYYLADLIVYADGAIDAGTDGLTDLDGLARQLRSGRVATGLTEGARVSAHHLASWRFTEVTSAIEAETLLAEVADDIDRLNDRPDSTGRCLLAVQAYLADPSEDNRLLVRQGHLAIPEHLRVYALGDMDERDQPLRVLATAVGDVVEGYAEDEVVTPELHAEAVEYFRGRGLDRPRPTVRIRADGPDQPSAPTLTIVQGRQDRPENGVLQNGWPAEITVDGRVYPSVTHAYWALSTSDPEWRDLIAIADDTYDVVECAEEAPRRPDWPAIRLAVMARLLRAKFTEHPDMARTLLATGDARIVYTGPDAAYWTASTEQSSNWIGRLLELVRSELAAGK